MLMNDTIKSGLMSYTLGHVEDWRIIPPSPRKKLFTSSAEFEDSNFLNKPFLSHEYFQIVDECYGIFWKQ